MAVRILTSLVRDGKSLSDLLPAAQLDLEAREAAMLQELAFGVCRNYGQLDAIVNELLQKPLRNKDTDVRMLLWLALYEIAFMRTPDYAVTSSYVSLTQKIKKNWAKGLVNATLRNYLRRGDELLEIAAKKNPHSLPEWLYKRISKDWPAQASEVFAAMNTRAPLTLRANVRLTDRSTLSAKFDESGLSFEDCEHAPQGLRMVEAPPVTSLPGFQEGEFSVQDQSAQLAAMLVQPQAGERVLDACAAPGGKSCHLLEIEPKINLHCLDDDDKRLERVRQNLDRLKLTAKIHCADANSPDKWWDGEAYDAILLDAPCSAVGALRRHPDIRLLRRESDIRALARQQLSLLNSLWPLLKPGGRLIYATCSVLKQENEQSVDKFLASESSASEVPIDAEWGVATSRGRQILPGQHQADGFYYCLLTKAKSAVQTSTSQFSPNAA